MINIEALEQFLKPANVIKHNSSCKRAKMQDICEEQYM